MAVRARFSASVGVCVVRGFFFRGRTLSSALIWPGSHFWNRWLQRHGYRRLLRKNIPGLERDEVGDKLIPRATDVHDVAAHFTIRSIRSYRQILLGGEKNPDIIGVRCSPVSSGSAP